MRRLFSIALLILLASCTEPLVRYESGVYTSENVEFRVADPAPPWKRVTNIEDNELAFWNDELGAAIGVNATCKEYEDMPLKAMANHLLMGFEDRKHLVWERRDIAGRESLYVVISGKIDGVRVMVAAYVLINDYCTFDLIYHAPPSSFEEGLGELHRMVGEFAVLRTGGN